MAPLTDVPTTMVTLRDGAAVAVRALGSDEEPALRGLLHRVSSESLALRFFGAPQLDRMAGTLVAEARAGELALVAEALRGAPGALVRGAPGALDPAARAPGAPAPVTAIAASAWAREPLPGAIVAHAGWFRTGPDRAEVAFLVDDGWQGRGLGAALLARLAEEAGRRGVATLTAQVLPRNRRMLAVFAHSGYPVEMRDREDAVCVWLHAGRRQAAALPAA